MNRDNIIKQTGKGMEEWGHILDSIGARNLRHKDIVCILLDDFSVTPWWAQRLTVEYEKFIGRRILGQREDGLFQLGARKTMDYSATTLWSLIREHNEFWGNSAGESGAETTLLEGSHFRMQWHESSWQAHSILQVRVSEGTKPGKSVCTIHHEKLPSVEERDRLIDHWKNILEILSKLTPPVL